MKTEDNNTLSQTRLNRLRVQGYVTQTDQELNELAFGHRFALRLCLSVMIIGLLTANIYILGVLTVIAFSTIILPYHPFDYIYNHAVRHWVNKPALPKRSAQLKFSCGMATIFLVGMVYFFATGQPLGAYILGGVIITVGTLVTTIDFCIPSMTYNALFGKKATVKEVLS